jgi:hypothetical protein
MSHMQFVQDIAHTDVRVVGSIHAFGQAHLRYVRVVVYNEGEVDEGWNRIAHAYLCSLFFGCRRVGGVGFVIYVVAFVGLIACHGCVAGLCSRCSSYNGSEAGKDESEMHVEG